jgi:RNA polymerase sigma-70 factor, ECF subfamily
LFGKVLLQRRANNHGRPGARLPIHDVLSPRPPADDDAEGGGLVNLGRPSRRGGSSPLRLVGPRDGHEPSDAELVAALLAGEDGAAAAVWNRHAPMVYRLLDRALGSATDSQDLTQEVFWRVFVAMKRLRDPDALRSFIYSAAVRILRWHLRARRIRRLVTLSDTGTVVEQPSAPEDSEGRELLGRFYRLLDTLSANDRTAFVLRRIEGLRLDEIVQATGASLATVKRRIRRGTQQLERLANADPDLARYLVRRRGPDDS